MVTIHFDALVASALELLCRDAAVLANGALEALKSPDLNGQARIDAKKDATFLARRLNAANKALWHWQRGVRPERTPNGDYLIPSGSRGGVIHRANKVGGVWVCSCEAGQKNEHHWHEDLLAALDTAHDAMSIKPEIVELDDWGKAERARKAEREMAELFEGERQ